MSVLLAAVTCFLAGLSWVVQLVVYPGFRLVGPTPALAAYHREHCRRITWVVGPPWAVQGVCVAVLLLRRDCLGLVLPIAALAAATVALTVLGAVPAHGALSSYDDRTVDRLLRASAWRTAAWTAGAVLSLLLLRC